MGRQKFGGAFPKGVIHGRGVIDPGCAEAVRTVGFELLGRRYLFSKRSCAAPPVRLSSTKGRVL
jgi:hypothetical protein